MDTQSMYCAITIDNRVLEKGLETSVCGSLVTISILYMLNIILSKKFVQACFHGYQLQFPIDLHVFYGPHKNSFLSLLYNTLLSMMLPICVVCCIV